MTISGRVPLLLLLGVAAVVLRPSGSTVLLWLLGVLLLAGLDLLLTPSPGTIGLSRRPPGTVRLGDPAASVLVVANPGPRRVHLQVRDAWQPSAGAGSNRFRLHLRGGDQRRVTTPLLPRRRGDLRAAGVTVRSWGPLGLVARQRTYAVPGSVRALPPFDSRKHLPSRLARLRELDGRAAVRVRGQGTEFDSLREYVRGDDVRSIDWRASARQSHVVVRTWQPERDRRVVLVLDTSRTSAGRVARVAGEDETDGMPRLDAAMDAALLLGALASRAGDRIDFAAGDRRVRARQRLHGVRDVAARLQEQMADLDPTLVEADWDVLAGAVQGFGRQRALVVLLTALEPSAIADGLLPVLPALTRHHRVVLASVRDPELTRLAEAAADPDVVPTADTAYDAAAAAQELHRRDRMREVLQRLGVDVVDTDADTLPPALADHYLALKAQGLL
ncbi:DUF58 domain-containing protein [Pimelobacter simplex]|uniref:Putative conserved membrane protein n=1 Tax=Nocardioides simplex TaxID=2045 RepID=A0A0A1DPY6_NOCSI|nr:DUF58 domain-containing protein [Pimelobacter simplex]AIY18677.1 putative conserved membrane protein [Pimelobacter simplex]MCG8152222.1 DUF58 domain-containing protein [Pimelobacter simplex]GEB14337.1 lipoprotein [Pimelobacter simplex]SFM30903.1 Uncharacterized conserved protein, DUF58 family, contains vWF domain [Pimelobacter simplex]